MEPLTLTPNHGWLWIKQGFALFMKAPLLWPALVFLGIFAVISLSKIPVIGDPLASLLIPILFAILMVICRTVDRDGQPDPTKIWPTIWPTVQPHSTSLITLGGITLVGKYAIFGVMKATGGAILVDMMLGNQVITDNKVLEQAIQAAGSSVFLGILLFGLLMMATQFAPLLVVFNQCTPAQALLLSLRAFKNNMLPITLYAFILGVLGVAATLPMQIGWLVWLPLTFTSCYACYCSIYPKQAANT